MLRTNAYTPILLHLEASTMCQATCGHCPRTLHHNSLPTSRNITFDEYSKHLLPYFDIAPHVINNEYIHGLTNLTICGNFGDPMMNPDIAQIAISSAELIRKHHDSVKRVFVDTNGGIGKSSDYYEMARAGCTMVMSLEGMSQEVHERYRQEVNIDKVFENIEAVKDGYTAGGFDPNFGILAFYVIPWAHTIEDLPKIIQYAKEVGAVIRIPRPRTNLDGLPCFDINGNLVDIITINENTLNFKFGSYAVKANNPDPDVMPIEQLEKFNWGDPLPIKESLDAISYSRKRLSYRMPGYFEESEQLFQDPFLMHNNPVKINCSAKKQQGIYVSADLTVAPCCHMQTHLDSAYHGIQTYPTGHRFSTIIEQYIKLNGTKNFNLRNYSLEEIITSDNWNDWALNFIEGKKTIKHCQEICGLCT